MEPPQARPPFWTSPFGIAASLAAVALSLYLYLAHEDHVLALLPYVFLAACPLMHMVMHRGHGHGGQQHGGGRDGDAPRRN